MGGLSLMVALMPTMGLVALGTGLVLTRITGRSPGRKTWLLNTGYSHSGAVEYLYVPCVRMSGSGSMAEPRRWVQEVQIVKKTAKLIYYASDSWDRREAVVSPGCISREQFETDTRCRGYCPADTRGVRCARHGYTWEHCRHGEHRCCHGYPAGVIPVPSDRHRPGPAGRLFFATRQAAEDELNRAERGRAEQGARQPPPIRQLRRAMADAHPDRGGTAEQFIQARRRYQMALRLGPAA